MAIEKIKLTSESTIETQTKINNNFNEVSNKLDTIPTKTSEITNDGDGTSKFATEQYVNDNGGKIDKIKVNDVEQEISATDKSVNISIPTKTSDIVNDGNGTSNFATLAELKASETSLDGKITSKLDKVPDGSNALIDNNNKISSKYLPDYILGQLLYGGDFNATTKVATLSVNAKSKLGVTTNNIILTNDSTSKTGYVDNNGIYYITAVSGAFADLTFDIGDWLISNGSSWRKIDNTDAVSSVNGKTGVVVLRTSDISENNDKLYVSSTEKNTWNNKQDYINSISFTADESGWSNAVDGFYTLTKPSTKIPFAVFNSNNEQVLAGLKYDRTNIYIITDTKFSGSVKVY